MPTNELEKAEPLVDWPAGGLGVVVGVVDGAVDVVMQGAGTGTTGR